MAKVLGMDGTGSQPTPQPQKQITIDQTTPVVCPNCEGDVFFPGVKFRKVSKLISGAPNDQYVPVEIYSCGGCGEILQEMLPKDLR
jgi:DNA-directed RNA polymerase subunit RPC12/RpoP